MSGVSGFQLRTLVPADYDRVIALWRDTEGMGLGASDTREAVEAFLLRNPGLSRVAEDARTGELAGAVLCGHDGRRGYLHHLAVAKPLRGRGLGRWLAEACLAELGALGLEKCTIFLFADNEAGMSFWRHAGWKARTDLVVVQKTLA